MQKNHSTIFFSKNFFITFFYVAKMQYNLLLQKSAYLLKIHASSGQ
jgi:hypothetical protein